MDECEVESPPSSSEEEQWNILDEDDVGSTCVPYQDKHLADGEDSMGVIFFNTGKKN